MRPPTRQTLTAGTVIATAAMLLAGCAARGLPVHADVEWEGTNTGPHEDDPRVKILREYVVQLNAADNALNYSDDALTSLATEWGLESSASNTAGSATGFWGDSVTLWEGPTSFSVVGIEDLPYERAEVTVCERWAPWWSLDKRHSETSELVDERDGMYRFEQPEFTISEYELVKRDGRWWIDGGGHGFGGDACDPGKIAIGTYTTPPDLDLLRKATPDMVIGPDGRPADS
ncbi:hypothetical protein [Myceligenerans crystallogenes]|uniref:Lipoprotein n=1 Tax=Myceligenerans crystallogenes TaxID=316335 RepID=A0ABN2NGP8_9MICO